jgi:hypothetical protein
VTIRSLATLHGHLAAARAETRGICRTGVLRSDSPLKCHPSASLASLTSRFPPSGACVRRQLDSDRGLRNAGYRGCWSDPAHCETVRNDFWTPDPIFCGRGRERPRLHHRRTSTVGKHSRDKVAFPGSARDPPPPIPKATVISGSDARRRRNCSGTHRNSFPDRCGGSIMSFGASRCPANVGDLVLGVRRPGIYPSQDFRG